MICIWLKVCSKDLEKKLQQEGIYCITKYSSKLLICLLVSILYIHIRTLDRTNISQQMFSIKSGPVVNQSLKWSDNRNFPLMILS